MDDANRAVLKKTRASAADAGDVSHATLITRAGAVRNRVPAAAPFLLLTDAAVARAKINIGIPVSHQELWALATAVDQRRRQLIS